MTTLPRTERGIARFDSNNGLATYGIGRRNLGKGTDGQNGEQVMMRVGHADDAFSLAFVRQLGTPTIVSSWQKLVITSSLGDHHWYRPVGPQNTLSGQEARELVEAAVLDGVYADVAHAAAHLAIVSEFVPFTPGE